MTSSNGNIFRVISPLCGEFTGPGEFPTQRPVTRSFDVFFELRLSKRLSKQPWGWWFETPSWSLWRHCNAIRGKNRNHKIVALSSTRSRQIALLTRVWWTLQCIMTRYRLFTSPYRGITKRVPDSKVHGQHGAHLGPTGPRCAPCWPHELCYLGWGLWSSAPGNQRERISYQHVNHNTPELYRHGADAKSIFSRLSTGCRSTDLCFSCCFYSVFVGYWQCHDWNQIKSLVLQFKLLISLTVFKQYSMLRIVLVNSICSVKYLQTQ